METLENSRENDRDMETATIAVDIAFWNQKLTLYKYQNTLFFLEDYVDDRFTDLEPID